MHLQAMGMTTGRKLVKQFLVIVNQIYTMKHFLILDLSNQESVSTMFNKQLVITPANTFETDFLPPEVLNKTGSHKNLMVIYSNC